MPRNLHPTAIIDPGAELAPDVTVGPYAIIGQGVTLGEGCEVGHHATIEGRTTVGPRNTFFPYACVGLKTQDLKYAGGEPGLTIGEGNVFREFCTVHTATAAGDETRIGNRNLFLAYTHIAHDCQIGDQVILSNNATLAGHVVVEDGVVMGGFAGVHQFSRVGTMSMIGGMTKVTQDVPPFFIADGNPSYMRAVNVIGLERKGFSKEEIEDAKKLFRILYRDKLNRSQALECITDHEQKATRAFQIMLTFLGKSKRGLVPGTPQG